MPRIKTSHLYSTQSLYVIKLIIEAGLSPNPLSCVPLSDKASFHQVHSSYLVTPSNHHLAAHYQHPCPLITIHPSTEREWGQSCFNFDQHTKAINLKMFQLQAGVPSCQGDFMLDIWAANELWAEAVWPFQNRETQIFMRVAHVRISQCPFLAKAESKRDGCRGRKENHWYSGILQQKRKPNVFAGEEWRCGGGEEGLRDRAEKKKKNDTKGPCVNVVALRLKIMNTIIICKLSILQHTRSVLLAAAALGRVWFWHALVGCAMCFGGFQLHERGLAELHGNTKSLSASRGCRREVHCSLSALPRKACPFPVFFHFNHFSIYLCSCVIIAHCSG